MRNTARLNKDLQGVNSVSSDADIMNSILGGMGRHGGGGGRGGRRGGGHRGGGRGGRGRFGPPWGYYGQGPLYDYEDVAPVNVIIVDPYAERKKSSL